MTNRRLLAVGGLLVAGGAVLVLFGFVDRTQEPKRSATTQPSAAIVRPTPLRGFGTVSVTITDPAGKTRKRCLLAARTEAQQIRGLMQVRDRTLQGHAGMIFLFKTLERTGFWMRNTPMPLSIAYFDQAGRVVSMTDMTPCSDTPDCPSYPPAGLYAAAIEVPQGQLDALGIERGAHLAVGGSCGAQ